MAVNEWEASGRHSGYLLHGTRLDDYCRWATTTQLRLTAAEHDFISEAVAARTAGEADEADREKVRLRLQRRSRHLLVGLFVAAAVLTGVIAYPIVTRPGDPGTIVSALVALARAPPSTRSLHKVSRPLPPSSDSKPPVLEPPYTDLPEALRIAGL